MIEISEVEKSVVIGWHLFPSILYNVIYMEVSLFGILVKFKFSIPGDVGKDLNLQCAILFVVVLQSNLLKLSL